MTFLVETLTAAVVDSIKKPLDIFVPSRDEVTSIEGGASPLSSSSSSSSPLPRLSPPSSPPALLLQEKAEADFPWLAADELGPTCHIGVDDGQDDAFSGMDWMTERVDLSGFDLDSIIGSCSPDGSLGSPDDLMDSFECPIVPDSLPLPTPTDLPIPADPVLPTPDFTPHDPADEVCSSPPVVPDPQEELEIKSEPHSPVPSPHLAFSLDLGSEVDISASVVEQPPALSLPKPVPRILLSLSPTRILLLLAPKKEVGLATPTTTSFPDVLSSNSGCSYQTASTRLQIPNVIVHRSRAQNLSEPYPSIPGSKAQHSGASSPAELGGKMRSSAVGPTKVKRLKKMEQNKTAATRYRQKKKVEQEAISAECDRLEQRNFKLAEKADSIANEIQYLKDLLEEVRQVRTKKAL
ncbi:hypothetical protein DPEC_G00275260 [Dallia pectoralis]|uniref:Uncharacterized protein n=1 Tax=Dallia pectoralis TaxID=75939 RepID=A0ACC2FL67_DALPE|nr:hypothetical protein DPEC_G00275260 [Dallia pectoralis]